MISVTDLTIRQGSFSLQRISFRIPTGAYAVLMGASGSGKTTLVECLCGLRRPAQGRIEMAKGEVTQLPPGQRSLGYVPQDSALFPTMRIRRQLDFALRLRGLPRSSCEAQVAQLAAWLGIEALLDRRPFGLSGGERQRIALGRALAADPQVLLLDEPLAAVDEDRRLELCTLLARIHKERGLTVLHITHSSSEAATLATVRLRLQQGQVITEPCKP